MCIRDRVWSMLKATVQVWLVPFLLLELLLIYGAGRVGKEQKNRELRAAYVELGQMQKRLELALHAAQRAAAVSYTHLDVYKRQVILRR